MANRILPVLLTCLVFVCGCGREPFSPVGCTVITTTSSGAGTLYQQRGVLKVLTSCGAMGVQKVVSVKMPDGTIRKGFVSQFQITVGPPVGPL